ncbi:hypothetical protein C8R43DRAFT_562946 [Mycena crocata]|nr:hypothetical protein C8R43DRAFT_562946 [Mycena crocata]
MTEMDDDPDAHRPDVRSHHRPHHDRPQSSTRSASRCSQPARGEGGMEGLMQAEAASAAGWECGYGKHLIPSFSPVSPFYHAHFPSAPRLIDRLLLLRLPFCSFVCARGGAVGWGGDTCACACWMRRGCTCGHGWMCASLCRLAVTRPRKMRPCTTRSSTRIDAPCCVSRIPYPVSIHPFGAVSPPTPQLRPLVLRREYVRVVVVRQSISGTRRGRASTSIRLPASRSRGRVYTNLYSPMYLYLYSPMYRFFLVIISLSS